MAITELHQPFWKVTFRLNVLLPDLSTNHKPQPNKPLKILLIYLPCGGQYGLIAVGSLWINNSSKHKMPKAYRDQISTL